MKVNESKIQADILDALQEISHQYKCTIDVTEPRPAIMGSDICMLEVSVFLTWEDKNNESKI